MTEAARKGKAPSRKDFRPNRAFSLLDSVSNTPTVYSPFGN